MFKFLKYIIKDKTNRADIYKKSISKIQPNIHELDEVYEEIDLPIDHPKLEVNLVVTKAKYIPTKLKELSKYE